LGTKQTPTGNRYALILEFEPIINFTNLGKYFEIE